MPPGPRGAAAGFWTDGLVSTPTEASRACPECGGPLSADSVCPRCAAPKPGTEEREFGLLLFEAEESLARGSSEKALVLASKAVKVRPDSLTARALMDRARRELLRGKRKAKLEERLEEARTALESGDLKSSEKIVLSALKVVPDHPLAQELFKQLKQARLGPAEAEAERELAALASSQVQGAIQAAKAANRAGWDARALLSIRRGLRLVPDSPELLEMLRTMQQAEKTREDERARRFALVSQVRAGRELLRAGQIPESLTILRAVLDEDPDNARAQAAIQEVRRAWLSRSQKTAPPPQEKPPLRGVLDKPEAVVLAPPALAPPVKRPPLRRPPIPAEIRLPRTVRRSTPLGWVLGGGAVVVALTFALARSGVTPLPSANPSPLAFVVPQREPAQRTEGPLQNLEPPLRDAIEHTLAAYAHALESHSDDLLSQARPDLLPEERAALLAPYTDALSGTADLRVLDVAVRGDWVEVPILRTDLIVGRRESGGSPAEETLRFQNRNGVWSLVTRKAGDAR